MQNPLANTVAIKRKALPLNLGWKEWCALPALNVGRIRAKIDTGAKTSALHALNMELVQKEDGYWVQFQVNPYSRKFRPISCEAKVIDHRVITSSNGQKEKRVVIKTTVVLGQQKRRIFLTLTDRSEMNFKLLLGREALKNATVYPDQAYLLAR